MQFSQLPEQGNTAKHQRASLEHRWSHPRRGQVHWGLWDLLPMKFLSIEILLMCAAETHSPGSCHCWCMPNIKINWWHNLARQSKAFLISHWCTNYSFSRKQPYPSPPQPIIFLHMFKFQLTHVLVVCLTRQAHSMWNRKSSVSYPRNKYSLLIYRIPVPSECHPLKIFLCSHITIAERTRVRCKPWSCLVTAIFPSICIWEKYKWAIAAFGTCFIPGITRTILASHSLLFCITRFETEVYILICDNIWDFISSLWVTYTVFNTLTDQKNQRNK